MRTTQPAGFSLMELAAVVGIIGILAVIAVPGYAKYRSRTYRREAKQALEAIYAAEKAYFARRRTYTDSFDELGLSTLNAPGAISYGFDTWSSASFTARARYRAACKMTVNQGRTFNESAWTDPC